MLKHRSTLKKNCYPESRYFLMLGLVDLPRLDCTVLLYFPFFYRLHRALYVVNPALFDRARAGRMVQRRTKNVNAEA